MKTFVVFLIAAVAYAVAAPSAQQTTVPGLDSFLAFPRMGMEALQNMISMIPGMGQNGANPVSNASGNPGNSRNTAPANNQANNGSNGNE